MEESPPSEFETTSVMEGLIELVSTGESELNTILVVYDINSTCAEIISSIAFKMSKPLVKIRVLPKGCTGKLEWTVNGLWPLYDELLPMSLMIHPKTLCSYDVKRLLEKQASKIVELAVVSYHFQLAKCSVEFYDYLKKIKMPELKTFHVCIGDYLVGGENYCEGLQSLLKAVCHSNKLTKYRLTIHGSYQLPSGVPLPVGVEMFKLDVNRQSKFSLQSIDSTNTFASLTLLSLLIYGRKPGQLEEDLQLFLIKTSSKLKVLRVVVKEKSSWQRTEGGGDAINPPKLEKLKFSLPAMQNLESLTLVNVDLREWPNQDTWSGLPNLRKLRLFDCSNMTFFVLIGETRFYEKMACFKFRPDRGLNFNPASFDFLEVSFPNLEKFYGQWNTSDETAAALQKIYKECLNLKLLDVRYPWGDGETLDLVKAFGGPYKKRFTVTVSRDGSTREVVSDGLFPFSIAGLKSLECLRISEPASDVEFTTVTFSSFLLENVFVGMEKMKKIAVGDFIDLPAETIALWKSLDRELVILYRDEKGEEVEREAIWVGDSDEEDESDEETESEEDSNDEESDDDNESESGHSLDDPPAENDSDWFDMSTSDEEGYAQVNGKNGK